MVHGVATSLSRQPHPTKRPTLDTFSPSHPQPNPISSSTQPPPVPPLQRQGCVSSLTTKTLIIPLFATRQTIDHICQWRATLNNICISCSFLCPWGKWFSLCTLVKSFLLEMWIYRIYQKPISRLKEGSKVNFQMAVGPSWLATQLHYHLYNKYNMMIKYNL